MSDKNSGRERKNNEWHTRIGEGRIWERNKEKEKEIEHEEIEKYAHRKGIK